MKSKFGIYVVIFFLLSLISCKKDKVYSEKITRTITDMAGRKVEIPVNVQSAFIDRHSVMLVYSFDTLLPVNRVFNYNDSEKKYLTQGFYVNKPLVINENAEEIIRLQPDIILFSKALTEENRKKADQLQKKVNIPVVLLDNDFHNYKSTLSFLGNVLNKKEKSEKLNNFIRTYVDSIPIKAKQIPENKRKKVYYAEGNKGLKTDPSGSLHSLLIDLVGGINVAQVDILPGKGMTGVSIEQIYLWNPDIVLVWSGNYDSKDSYMHIRHDKLWKDLKSVKENKVYQVPWKPFGWIDRPPGINRLIGIIWLSQTLYPEVYTQNLNKITQEYFKEFYHYNLNEEEAAELINPQPN
ncbi:ABC transporter substrate-binding protein [Apibacter sp. HY039]|uniref:ABC transporter substrate-binding protein n=1 Tax=Apibacter sp. HY039 TaxID=2501476 RepID=UPI000FEB8715|nr:ABC transporter substrate-binding protein [Apibacter sp. HY039]